jgi:hypothetical protein
MKLSVALSCLLGVAASAADSTKSPPPFFLQDPKDSLCLAGEDFRRCSIDTLFYVVGSPGTFHTCVRSKNTDVVRAPFVVVNPGLPCS